MKVFLFLISIFSVTSFSGNTIGATNSYQCQITSDATIGDDGNIAIHPKSLNLGKKFAVDRKTGVVIGDVFFTFGEPKVFAVGSKDNAFKVIWIKNAGGSNGMFIDYLSIEEFAKGDKKPFAYFTGSQITSGLCE